MALSNSEKVGISQTYEVYDQASMGGKIGIVFFVVWIIWCVCAWDGEGTERPAWGWLDWLG